MQAQSGLDGKVGEQARSEQVGGQATSGTGRESTVEVVGSVTGYRDGVCLGGGGGGDDGFWSS